MNAQESLDDPLFALELKVARRADELARDQHRAARTAQELWNSAEREILGARPKWNSHVMRRAAVAEARV